MTATSLVELSKYSAPDVNFSLATTLLPGALVPVTRSGTAIFEVDEPVRNFNLSVGAVSDVSDFVSASLSVALTDTTLGRPRTSFTRTSGKSAALELEPMPVAVETVIILPLADVERVEILEFAALRASRDETASAIASTSSTTTPIARAGLLNALWRLRRSDGN